MTEAVESGMLNLESLCEEIMAREKQKVLKNHRHKIWVNSKGRWLTYVDDSGGRRRQLSSMSKKGLEDAIYKEWKDRQYNPTVRQLFDDWNDRRLHYEKISEATHYRNQGIFRRHFETFGRRRVAEIEEDDIITFLEDEAFTKRLSQKQFANLKTVIRGMWKYARRKKCSQLDIEAILRNADVTEIRFRKVRKEDYEEVFSEDETDLMIAHLVRNQDRVNLCILLMFVTGLRVGEAVTLKPEDIGDNFVNVRRCISRYRKDGEWIITVKDFPKTQAGWRSVVVPEAYVWVLGAIRRQNPFGEYIFEGQNGMPMSTFTVRTRLDKLCKDLNIYRKSPHKIRKTYGSILLDNGCDKEIVKQQMGHTDILTTEVWYHRNRRTLDARQKVISELPDFKRANY